MKRIIFTTLALAVVMAPAVQATTINLTNEGTFDFDANGNTLTHTEDGVVVKVTGWSTPNGTSFFAASRVRRFSTGLGMCATSENTSSLCQDPQHAVDNSGYKEVLLVTFSTPVLLTEAIISAWETDFDATFWAGTGTIAPVTGQTFATLNALAAGSTADTGHSEFSGTASDGQLRTVVLNPPITTPVSWLVFGAPPVDTDDNKADHFKFKTLGFTVPRQDTPEPGVLLLLGIGTALLAARARKHNAE